MVVDCLRRVQHETFSRTGGSPTWYGGKLLVCGQARGVVDESAANRQVKAVYSALDMLAVLVSSGDTEEMGRLAVGGPARPHGQNGGAKGYLQWVQGIYQGLCGRGDA